MNDKMIEMLLNAMGLKKEDLSIAKLAAEKFIQQQNLILEKLSSIEKLLQKNDDEEYENDRNYSDRGPNDTGGD